MKTRSTTEPQFPLGRVVMTPGARDALLDAEGARPLAYPEFEGPLASLRLAPYLRRHQTGDWGEIPAADRLENERSVWDGYRILSAYRLPTGVKLWIITEADRSVTTALLPDEY